VVLIGGLALILVLIAVGSWWLFSENKRLESEILDIKEILIQAENDLASTTAELQFERARNVEFAEQVSEIASDVGTLNKLSKVDRELLQKYSKVYFLSEHYAPPRFASVDEKYLNNPARELQVREEVWPFLDRLLKKASSSDVSLLVVSAYRSFGEQEILKNGYKVTYGIGANQFSADQGYSEHQLGTTVDFTTPELNNNFSNFGKTEAYRWLQNNAHKYGFVLSYPEKNSHYQFEPWHWRFVGVDLAIDLYEEGKSFYDLDQRQINEYLVKIFD